MSESPASKVSAHFRRTFMAGVLALMPIGATIWVIQSLFSVVDGWLQPAVKSLFDRPIPGVGFVATVVFVYVLGVIANNVAGRRLLRMWESIMARIPVIKGLYGGVKQVAEAFGPQSKDQFREVVLLEFPSAGSYALGFATVAVDAPNVGESRYVFVPTTPNPTSGYLLVVPVARLVPLSIGVEEGLKLVISGGVVGPASLQCSVAQPQGIAHT